MFDKQKNWFFDMKIKILEECNKNWYIKQGNL